MEGGFMFKLFRIICLVATGALFLRGCTKYSNDNSSTQIEYRAFNVSKTDIYPTITLCIGNNNPEIYQFGLYDLNKLNETYKIHDPREYIDFLSGYIWRDKFAEVDYDDVTLDINDRVEYVKVRGDK